MAASVMAATSALRPAAAAISSTHSMLISVESMSNATSLKSARRSGDATPRTNRPGANSWSMGSGRQCVFGCAERAQHIADEVCARRGLGRVALDAQLVVSGKLDVAVLLHQLDDAQRIDRRVRAEADHHQARCGVDLGHAEGFGEHAQSVHVEEGLALGGQLAE